MATERPLRGKPMVVAQRSLRNWDTELGYSAGNGGWVTAVASLPTAV